LYDGFVFRLVTPLIVLDLEATAGTDANGYQTNEEILDVGAVFLDTNLNPVGEFQSLVKVEGEITPFITQLTGIRPEDIADQPPWNQVGVDLLSWADTLSGGKLKQCRLSVWGTYFDIPLLRKNYQNLKMDFPFSGTALDIKSLAFLRQSLSGRRTDKLDLYALAQEMQLPSHEPRHRALNDAKLSADVLIKLWKELAGAWIQVPQSENWQHVQLTADKS